MVSSGASSPLDCIDRGWRGGLATALLVAALAASGLALAGALPSEPGFYIALFSSFLLDGAISLCFILVTTANTLLTPRELRGRVNAAGSMYASLVRALSVVLIGVLASGGSTLMAFVAIACCFGGASIMMKVK